MADAHAEGIDHHVRAALVVFGALLVLTVLTVAVAYIELPVVWGVTVALVIATTKGSLVALWFMHLISERGFIYLVLVFTGVFFLALLLLPIITGVNNVVV